MQSTRLFFMVTTLAWLMTTTLGSTGLSQPTTISLDPAQLSFVYQSYFSEESARDRDAQPQAKSCKVVKSDVGVHEFDVFCLVNGRTHAYGVHLVLSRYQKTRLGRGAYELLYWVTDRTIPRQRTHDSSTVWFHFDRGDDAATAIQVFQGIENDLASLQLAITL